MTDDTEWLPFKRAALVFNHDYVFHTVWTANHDLAPLSADSETVRFEVDSDAATWKVSFTRTFNDGKRDWTKRGGIGPVPVFDENDRLIEQASRSDEVKGILRRATAELMDLKNIAAEQLRKGELVARGVLENPGEHAAHQAQSISPAKFSLCQLMDAENGVFQDQHGKAILDVQVSLPAAKQSPAKLDIPAKSENNWRKDDQQFIELHRQFEEQVRKLEPSWPRRNRSDTQLAKDLKASLDVDVSVDLLRKLFGGNHERSNRLVGSGKLQSWWT